MIGILHYHALELRADEPKGKPRKADEGRERWTRTNRVLGPANGYVEEPQKQKAVLLTNA